MTERKLQVNINGDWHYVFNKNQIESMPIITDSPKQAITERYNNGSKLIDIYKQTFNNYDFRLV